MLKCRFFGVLLALSSLSVASAQGNSPYSRFGLGDLLPNSNISTRGMGGISAGYADALSVNFSNPASYSGFQVIKEPRTNKMAFGRVVLDAGVNFESKTLATNTAQKFTNSDAYFSYVQVGLPLRNRWGLTFGIRPVSRISYKIQRNERLKDPVSGNQLDSAVTQFSGSGGGFLPTIGTGFGIGKHLSVGVNVGYFFGRREINTTRSLINDTVLYYSAEHETDYSFSKLFFNAGLQYRIDLKDNKYIRLGAAGNWKQKLNAKQDILRQTYTVDAGGGSVQIDSVFQQNDVKGEIIYPLSYTVGFVVGSDVKRWIMGLDFTQSQWSDYRTFGQKDSLQDSWKIQAGGQYSPKPGSSYFSNVVYRAGLSYGRDYLKIGNSLPAFSASFGMALPIRISRMAPNQINAVNIALEYVRRGNKENVLRDNVYRLSLGFNFTDLWFGKRKYD
jgi:hypothetical protein